MIQKKIDTDDAIDNQTIKIFRKTTDAGNKKPSNNGTQNAQTTIKSKRTPIAKLTNTASRDNVLANIFKD